MAFEKNGKAFMMKRFWKTNKLSKQSGGSIQLEYMNEILFASQGNKFE